MSNFLSSTLASVAITDTDYKFESFEVDETANLAKFFTFGSAAANVLPGTYEGTIKLSGPLDQGNMTAFAPNAALSLTLTFTTAVTLDIDVVVKSCKLTANVSGDEEQKVEIEVWVTGTFTLGPV